MGKQVKNCLMCLKRIKSGESNQLQLHLLSYIQHISKKNVYDIVMLLYWSLIELENCQEKLFIYLTFFLL